MAAMEEEKIDAVVKIRQKHGKKDEPPKLLCNLPASMTFQQLLEHLVLDISNITASCRVGFKKRGEQLPTDFVDVRLSGSIGKLHVTGSNFSEYSVKEQDQYEERPPEK